MRCGLFGKLPAKRDFVTLSVPRSFLRVWEPWLEQGLLESRRQLGAVAWTHAFAAAPIWRFWLGENLCGRTIIGAFMSSMDACGRMFPLTLIGHAEAGEVLTPPIVDPLWAWFDRAEAILDAALDQATSFEATRAALLRFSGWPDGTPATTMPETGESVSPTPPQALQQRLADLAEMISDAPIASTTFFWTIGGATYEPAAQRFKFLPSPDAFPALLSQHFAPQPERSLGVG